MATDTESRVLRMLSAIEVPDNAAEQIEAMGAEAVNVVCEAALGTYVGLRPKVRTNAATIVGDLDTEQARQTLALLITDPNEDVAIRAMRAIARGRDAPDLVRRASLVLRRPDASPLLVVETIQALATARDQPVARQALEECRTATDPAAPAHRRSPVVQDALDRAGM